MASLSGFVACTQEPAKAPDDAYLATETPEPRPDPALAQPDPGPPAVAADQTTTTSTTATATATAPKAGAASVPPSSVAPNAAAAPPPPAGNPPPTPAPGVAPDNTKKNERDRDTAALTPVDQGNNESDLKITQRIRQAVMANDTLSFNAKNVKIITVKGKVTLRGPVKTDAERAFIETAAKDAAGAGQVDNQIEVKK